ncbi:MAG TPA: ABC transporter permease [Burkholderiales bacterium]|nr:ABC transporter permease [Burkholderiales bacterium]
MNPRRILAIARKELIQVRRDPRSLAIALLLPVMQMFLLGYGISLDIANIPTCVYDQEASQHSQALLARFKSSRYFRVVKSVRDYGGLRRAIDGGECQLGIVVPWNFSRQLTALGKTSVQAIVDATNDNTATLAEGYAQSVVSAYAGDEVELRFAGTARRLGAPQPLAVDSRVWFNEDLASRDFIIPGLVAMIMALVGALLTSLTLSREWERGTMELLISTPVTSMELMIGKLLPYFAIGLADAAFCVALAVGWFGVPFRGQIGTLLLTTLLFLAVVLGIGYAISASIRSQIGASQVALLFTMLPTAMLSGFSFPIDQMPAVIRAVTFVVYARYYVTIVKAVFLKGSGLAQLSFPIAGLLVYAAVITLVAARAFRKSIG